MKQHDSWYIALGAFYLVVGMVLGIVMGIQQDFALAPVHAHINLVGFMQRTACLVWSTRCGPA